MLPATRRVLFVLALATSLAAPTSVPAWAEDGDDPPPVAMVVTPVCAPMQTTGPDAGFYNSGYFSATVTNTSAETLQSVEVYPWNFQYGYGLSVTDTFPTLAPGETVTVDGYYPHNDWFLSTRAFGYDDAAVVSFRIERCPLPTVHMTYKLSKTRNLRPNSRPTFEVTASPPIAATYALGLDRNRKLFVGEITTTDGHAIFRLPRLKPGFHTLYFGVDDLYANINPMPKTVLHVKKPKRKKHRR